MAGPRTPKGRAVAIAARLSDEYPVAECELHHSNPFELLVATILSAQCTDARVNLVTPALFARCPDAAALAVIPPAELENLIRSAGFYQSKARHLLGMAQALLDGFGGQVPTAMEDLVTLPGVGRKTANVVRSVAFGLPGLPVDTHVLRLTHKWGLTTDDDPVKVEATLGAYLPADQWGAFSLRTILHGRRVCSARAPQCAVCLLEDLCPASLMPSRNSSAGSSSARR